LGKEKQKVNTYSMSCCPPTIITFYNVPSTTVDYSQALRDLHGRVPKVEVSYWDEDNDEYYLSTANRVSLHGSPVSSIIVDHGGSGTGILRIT
jgi:hypothetical protein